MCIWFQIKEESLSFGYELKYIFLKIFQFPLLWHDTARSNKNLEKSNLIWNHEQIFTWSHVKMGSRLSLFDDEAAFLDRFWIHTIHNFADLCTVKVFEKVVVKNSIFDLLLGSENINQYHDNLTIKSIKYTGIKFEFR